MENTYELASVNSSAEPRRSTPSRDVDAAADLSSTTQVSGSFEHELFIIHADADASFVHGYLLPAVALAPGRVLLSSGLAPGAPRIAELERVCRQVG